MIKEFTRCYTILQMINTSVRQGCKLRRFLSITPPPAGNTLIVGVEVLYGPELNFLHYTFGKNMVRVL